MSPFHALILGVVEGLTEFLPVSSTGHLILAAHGLGIGGESVKTFEIVIQAGALAAILALYRHQVISICRGVCGSDPEGRRLLSNLLTSFLPVAVAGVALHRPIKHLLFDSRPVAAALAVGGVFMIWLHRWQRRHAPVQSRGVASLTLRQAFLIGLAQCLSLWPGTSRSMVTIAAGLLAGLPIVAAAEYSFLLAIPTLGAATLFDAVGGGAAWIHQIGPSAVAIGFISAAVTAVLAVRAFIGSLTRLGLAPFGWYRLALALAVCWFLRS